MTQRAFILTQQTKWFEGRHVCHPRKTTGREQTGGGGGNRIIGGGVQNRFWGGVWWYVFPSPEFSTPLCFSLNYLGKTKRPQTATLQVVARVCALGNRNFGAENKHNNKVGNCVLIFCGALSTLKFHCQSYRLLVSPVSRISVWKSLGLNMWNWRGILTILDVNSGLDFFLFGGGGLGGLKPKKREKTLAEFAENSPASFLKFPCRTSGSAFAMF